MPSFATGKRWFDAELGPITCVGGSQETFSVGLPTVIPNQATLLRSIFGYTAVSLPSNDTGTGGLLPPLTYVGITWFPVDDPSDGEWEPGSGGEAVYADFVEWQLAAFGDGGSLYFQSPGGTIVRESRSQRVVQDRDTVQLSLVVRNLGLSDVPGTPAFQPLDVIVFGWWRYLVDCH